MAFRGELEALILGALQSGPLHGYEITRRISGREDSILKLKEGQVYPILHQMENDGKVIADWLPQEGKPARKVYALTERGVKELDSKRVEWSRVSE
jgi:DNA-binding PadR family transcriptional regulator